jgi:hypothetical protein
MWLKFISSLLFLFGWCYSFVFRFDVIRSVSLVLLARKILKVPVTDIFSLKAAQNLSKLTRWVYLFVYLCSVDLSWLLLPVCKHLQ